LAGSLNNINLSKTASKPSSTRKELLVFGKAIQLAWREYCPSSGLTTIPGKHYNNILTTDL
jgi:hypothetical protein